jgi:phage I-like protein
MSKTNHALAACSFAVTMSADENAGVQIFPAGNFTARDGRPTEIACWVIDKDIAQRLLSLLRDRQTDMVFDYEHQTIFSEQNGQPAPAAGWAKCDAFEWRNDGLYATKIEWTDKAKEFIKSGEYRYISPVFSYDRKTGEVLALHHVALTNFPAIDGMDALTAIAAARFNPKNDKELDVNKQQLIALLQLKAEATDKDIENSIAALKSGHKDLTEEVAALKTKGTDLSQFVPINVVNELKIEIAALKANNTKNEVKQLVQNGLDTGRLLPAQEKWARDMGMQNIAHLKTFLAETPALAALKGQQTPTLAAPAPQTIADLSPTEVALCKAMGVNPHDYLKQRQQDLNNETN